MPAPQSQHRDAWIWTVQYTDGHSFPELGPDGIGRGFALAMAEGEVAAVELRWAENPELPPIRVQIPDDAVRPIFFRVRTATFSGETGELKDTETNLTVLGWQKTISVGGFERNVKSFLWIQPDGTVILTDRDLDH